ncbi:MAG: NAD(P)-binding domain-containing protein [Blastocatellia bacterium]
MAAKIETSKNRFLIRRRDTDTAIDDVVLESEGLTIGRLVSNDLVLNHRAVSRTHAGIKEIRGEFWLFNLSQSNGTVLNGELVEKTALADGDVFRIGPFLIQVNYVQNALALAVERALDASAEWEAGAVPQAQGPGPSEEGVATIIMKRPPKPGSQTLTFAGSKRQEGTGLLRAAMPAQDEQALDLFWKNRKREAGKIAARTLLHPRGGQRLGKFQFNWRPTRDLARLWRKSYFYVGAAAILLLSLAAFLIYESAYSPGPVSSSHASMFAPNDLGKRNIALQSNGNSCSNCHGVTTGMQDKCIDCHRTQASPTVAAFTPTIYEAHDREGIACSSCHTEHQGKDIHAGLVAYQLCANCHNGAYPIKTGERAGRLLPVPHGGEVGYPVVYGKWQWKLTPDQIKRKGYPDAWAQYEPRDQFHAVHQLGRMAGRMSCGDCHTRGAFGDETFRTSPKDECAKCHGVSFTTTSATTAQVNCNTCHVQHGQKNDLARVVTDSGKDPQKLKTYLASLNAKVPPADQPRLATTSAGTGPAEVQRQNKAGINTSAPRQFGGLPWYIWVGLVGLLPIAGLAVMAYGTARRKSQLAAATAVVKQPIEQQQPTGSIDLEKVKAEGPAYPHPVVDPVLCIGCHACVEACPHDVLAIVNGISTPIALDQCMEDTGCTVECPTSPKACIVINTAKKIAKRKVPARDQKLMTNVEGVYMVGDVSGVPLIKNAINEGGQVIDYVVEDLKKEGANGNADYEVAIIGVGPAGLSAAVLAKQRGLRYVALEQDQIVATIANYPAGKFVFFKPDTVDAKGGIPLPGVGDKKESMLDGWTKTMLSNGVVINEEESCKDIKRTDGIFTVTSEKGKEKALVSYKARRVILAIGNRGTPQKLRVPGEEMKIPVPAESIVAKHCPKCGASRTGNQQFCPKCGSAFPARVRPAFDDLKVKYKLSDPDDYKGKRCIIVGAGNSAIEAAVDLSGFKRDGDQITFTRDNEVTLLVRSDLKGDLKLGNKMNLYDCIDAGKIKMLVRRAIKEIKADEVVLVDSRSNEEKERLKNDYIFALIGGEKPTKFLEGLGIKIG